MDQAAAAKGSVEDIASYRVWLTVLLDLHERYRMSWRLIEQDQADAIEMWIVEELKASGAGDRLGSELLERINLVFSNASQRDSARRQAIALSWHNARNSQLGGYQLDTGGSGYVTTKQVWEAGRRVGVVSELLLKSLDANQSEQVDLRREIAQMLGFDAAANQEKYLKNAQGEEELLYYETLVNSIPGAFWHGPWESEGAKLVRELL